MISQQEWDELKSKEQYGMFSNLFDRVAALEDRVANLEFKHVTQHLIKETDN
jgi:hypothetical protein